MNAQSVVVDGCAPLLSKPGAWKGWLVGGVDLAIPTVATHEAPDEALPRVADWRRWVKKHDQLFQVVSHTGLDALGDRRLGICFHFQNTTPIGEKLALLEVYRDLGVRMIQLTYNYRNAVGDGCMEPGDRGLTPFGGALVAEMNRLGLVVDLSHTGHRTTLEAIEASFHPPVFSHSNARRLFDHPRNITDEQIRAVGEKGGLVGVNAVPSFLRSDGIGANLSDLLDHIDYLAEMIGPEHVCLGLDFWTDRNLDYEKWDKTGLWAADDLTEYVSWPHGICGPGHFPRLREGLVERGYSPGNIAAIMGNNWVRLFRQVWK